MKSALIIISLLFLPTVVSSATIHVPGDFPTIQGAIDAAVKGDTVLVYPGTYVENIDFKGKAISVMSSDGSGKTVIDGNQAASVVICSSGENKDSVIDGFTIVNGQANYGGGMYIDWSSPTVTNCTFSGNSAYYGGGGMYNGNSRPTVTNCIFSGNSVEISNGSPGGGMYNLKSILTVTNCTFTGNSADAGGGIINIGDCGPVTNCILWNNRPDEILNYQSSPVITFNCVQGGFPGIGNIDSDPLFVEHGYWHDNSTPGYMGDDFWVEGDYHLIYPSPCKDTGDNSAVIDLTDFEGDHRIAYGNVDIGADEFYTHMYWTGDAAPGGTVEVKLVGLPGTSPVFLWVGSGVLSAPIPTIYGDWHLDFPILLTVELGMNISPDGVSVLPYTFDPGFPAMDILIQSLIGMELSNLCIITVE